MARDKEQQGRQESGDSAEESVDPSPGRESREQLITSRRPPRAETQDPFLKGSPLAVIRRFSEDIEQLCESFGAKPWEPLSSSGGDSSSWPSVEVSQIDDKLIVEARLTGLQKEDIDVELRGSDLCISGKDPMMPQQPDQTNAGTFCRIVPLPRRVSADAVSAGFEGDTLRIEVRTSHNAASRGRRIEVRSGHGR